MSLELLCCTYPAKVSVSMKSTFDTVSTKALEPRELNLTCQGLSCVNWDRSDPDFEFVTEEKVCRVHSVLAEFLSPKVAHIRRCDPLCCVYTFENSELFHVFETLASCLCTGRSITVDQSNFVALLLISQELENSELLCSLLGMIKTESLNFEESILLLRAGIELGTAFSGQIGNLVDFVASHFYEIGQTVLDSLDLETAQLLLSSSSLKIEDEDSLYDFVRARSEDDLKFTSLFEFVYFEYLSVDRIENFASFVSENLLENISSGIWIRICGRLIIENKLKNKNPRVSTPPGIEFPYNSSKPLEGVIAHLTRQYGGNVHDKGIVNVTASSVNGNSSSYLQKHAVDLGTDSHWASNSETYAWLCYDFKERSVIPTSYSVRSISAGSGGCHLKSWVIEVSKDGKENSWREIDRRDNNNELNASRVTVNFKISRVPNESFRFIRLKQTGPEHCGSTHAHLSSLEIFGTLYEQ